MRVNRTLPPLYEGDYDWIDGQRHIMREGGSLCGLSQAGPYTSYYVLRQDELCPRCWQRWRSEQGGSVRGAWEEKGEQQ